MYIDKNEWIILKDYIKELSTDYKNGLNDLIEDNLHDAQSIMENIERTSSNKIYVITNNAVVDDVIDYQIYDIATNKNDAQRIFNKAIEDAKCDVGWNTINPINIDNIDNTNELNEVWCYSISDNSFNLYQNGNYNSNNFSTKETQLEKLHLEQLYPGS